mmetsp:Transcript_13593/g.40496  ORF Transcript_13593/g.40496 Transcript_13593/m.40496 type:complete len:224 (+) Transcript_13593:354-1025(+)
MKVCVVYGSESGNAERQIRGICKKWEQAGGGFEIGAIVEGAAAAAEGLEALAEKYDVLAVCTSSNGEGDPPHNFHPFLKALYEARAAGGKPLASMKHAVLGFGCSHFDTFQNCPRLADKLLGELGSTRCVARAEVDEVDGEAGDAAKAAWADAMLAQISGKAAPAGLAWTTPGDEILDKEGEMLAAAAAPANLAPFFLFGAVAVAVGAAGVLTMGSKAAEASA